MDNITFRLGKLKCQVNGTLLFFVAWILVFDILLLAFVGIKNLATNDANATEKEVFNVSSPVSSADHIAKTLLDHYQSISEIDSDLCNEAGDFIIRGNKPLIGVIAEDTGDKIIAYKKIAINNPDNDKAIVKKISKIVAKIDESNPSKVGFALIYNGSNKKMYEFRFCIIIERR